MEVAILIHQMDILDPVCFFAAALVLSVQEAIQHFYE
jgi:hypothetical protein